METKCKSIDVATAREFKDFILPVVWEDENFESFVFYVITVDDRMAGLLVADPRKVGPEILSVMISPEYSGQGLGAQLMTGAMCDMMTHYDGTEMPSPNYFGATVILPPIKVEAMERTFARCGFKAVDEGLYYEATVAMLKDSPLLNNPKVTGRIASGNSGYLPLRDVPVSKVKVFGNKLVQKNLVDGVFPDKLDDDLSIFGIKNNEIVCAVLFFKERDGLVQNALLYMPENSDKSKNGMFLLTSSAMAASKKYPPETRLSFFAGDAVTEKLIKKLLPKAQVVQKMKSYILEFYPELMKELESETDM